LKLRQPKPLLLKLRQPKLRQPKPLLLKLRQLKPLPPLHR